MTIAAILSFGQGLLIPSLSLLFGEITNGFSPTDTGDEIVDTVRGVSLTMIYFGVAVFVLAMIASMLWTMAAAK